MQTKWNTGRPYTKEGQIIAAVLVDGGHILFVDVSRMINGTIRAGVDYAGFEIGSEGHLQRSVLWCYDHGKYESYIWDKDAETKLMKYALTKE